MNIHLVYYSATGTTEQILHTMFDSRLIGCNIVSHNLTDSQNSGAQIKFSATDLVVFGIPVYSGRIPKVAINRFQGISGDNTPAVLIATYGNRDYDDALIELNDLVMKQGFKVKAAAAIVTEHSVVTRIASGRPNKADMESICKFADNLTKRNLADISEVTLPGNRPYRKYQGVPFKPKGNHNCVKYGLCVKMCPVNAISADSPKNTDRDRCVSCMRCVKYCPHKARGLSKIQRYISYKFIAGKCKREKHNEFFV